MCAEGTIEVACGPCALSRGCRVRTTSRRGVCCIPPGLRPTVHLPAYPGCCLLVSGRVCSAHPAAPHSIQSHKQTRAAHMLHSRALHEVLNSRRQVHESIQASLEWANVKLADSSNNRLDTSVSCSAQPAFHSLQSGSNRMSLLAPTRLSPQPPALLDSRNTNTYRRRSRPHSQCMQARKNPVAQTPTEMQRCSWIGDIIRTCVVCWVPRRAPRCGDALCYCVTELAHL